MTQVGAGVASTIEDDDETPAVTIETARKTTVEVVLPLGAPVPVAPGVVLRLLRVNTPGTGAHTAVVQVRHGKAAPSGPINKELSELRAVVEEIKQGQQQPSTLDVDVVETRMSQQLASMRGSLALDFKPLMDLLPTLTGLDPGELADMVAKALVSQIGSLQGLAETVAQVAEGVRLLLDE